MLKSYSNYIDGDWVAPLAGKYMENINPATGQITGFLPDSDGTDVDLAVRAADKAFSSWSKTPLERRSKFLFHIADALEKNADELARIESEDQGKPAHLAKAMDVARAVTNFRFFAEAILETEDTSESMDAHTLSTVIRKPVGVAGLISPWNLPLYLLTWKMAPALACGNTIVCKPSEFTSLTAIKFCEVIAEVGVPTGVINMVFGTGARAGDGLVRHPKVPLISFTGGTETGKKVIQASSEEFKKLSLELGGKNPNIIFADCDYEKMLKTTIRSSFLNQGEICLCGSRIYVEEKLYDRFLKDFIRETESLLVGDPADEKNFMGALISQSHLEKVESYIRLAEKEGGKIVAGGDRPELPAANQNGYFLRPTVITGLDESSRCVQEEIFGPVVTVASFKTVDEVCQRANAVRYGLSASVWTGSAEIAERLAEDLRVGTVWVNCWLVRDLRMPFGGMKHSGLGREGGKYSLDFYSELTTVCVRT